MKLPKKVSISREISKDLVQRQYSYLSSRKVEDLKETEEVAGKIEGRPGTVVF